VRRVPLSKIKNDFSRFLREAEGEKIVITRNGKPAGMLIGFRSEDDWLDYQFEKDPRLLRRIEQAETVCEKDEESGSRMSSENGPANPSSKLPPQSHRQSGWSASSARVTSCIGSNYGFPVLVAARAGRRGLAERAGRRRCSALSFSSGDEGRTYRRVSRNRQKSR
jgi:prevent-host-death family protein